MSMHRDNKRVRFLWVSLLVLTLVGSLALVAFAAEGQQETSSFKKIWMSSWRILNFLILAILLFKLLKQPVGGFFKESARVIREQLQKSEQECLDAEQELDEVENRLKSLDGEIRRLQGTIGELGERERDKIIANARQTAEQMLEKARLEAAYSTQQARSQLRREVIDEAVKIAERSIREVIDKRDQERLVDEYLQDLQQMSGSSV